MNPPTLQRIPVFLIAGASDALLERQLRELPADLCLIVIENSRDPQQALRRIDRIKTLRTHPNTHVLSVLDRQALVTWLAVAGISQTTAGSLLLEQAWQPSNLAHARNLALAISGSARIIFNDDDVFWQATTSLGRPVSSGSQTLDPWNVEHFQTRAEAFKDSREAVDLSIVHARAWSLLPDIFSVKVGLMGDSGFNQPLFYALSSRSMASGYGENYAQMHRSRWLQRWVTEAVRGPFLFHQGFHYALNLAHVFPPQLAGWRNEDGLWSAATRWLNRDLESLFLPLMISHEPLDERLNPHWRDAVAAYRTEASFLLARQFFQWVTEQPAGKSLSQQSQMLNDWIGTEPDGRGLQAAMLQTALRERTQMDQMLAQLPVYSPEHQAMKDAWIKRLATLNHQEQAEQDTRLSDWQSDAYGLNPWPHLWQHLANYAQALPLWPDIRLAASQWLKHHHPLLAQQLSEPGSTV